MSKKVKIGIIGLGHLHPFTYMPLFDLAGNCDVVAASDKLDQLTEQFKNEFGKNVYSDWKELLEKEEIELAYIFLPHDECPEAAVACAEKGINVVVEKPVSNTAEGAAKIKEACDKNNVLFSTPYLWRYHPVTREMKKIIDSGILGKIVGCEGRCAAGGLHRYIEGHSPWMLEKEKSGGGPMYNLGVHWIDLYRWLLDSEVTEVIGKNVHVNKDYNIEDNSFAITTFDNGATLALDISYTVPDSYPYGRDLYLAIRGTEGCVSFSPAFEGTKQTLFVCSNDPRFGGAPRKQIDFEMEAVPGYCGSLGLEYVKEISDNVINKEKAFIDGDDAFKALEIVEAIYKAAESGAIAKL
ncbi:MAG: Gfo/Idh/MocA family protein [Planctomycetota bacterium]|jgi:predicted dehydrogenase